MRSLEALHTYLWCLYAYITLQNARNVFVCFPPRDVLCGMTWCVPADLSPRDVPSGSPSAIIRCSNGVRARLVLDHNPVCVCVCLCVVGWGVGCVRRVCIYVCLYVYVCSCICVCVCVGVHVVWVWCVEECVCVWDECVCTCVWGWLGKCGSVSKPGCLYVNCM